MSTASDESDEFEMCDSLYSFYTYGGVHSGLQAEGETFKLNGRNLQIFSGSLHYFRVLPHRWKDSIRKMRECGLNTVCTYVPWNLHEDTPNCYDFEGILDLRAFIETVQDEDMFLILRPGPYICAEFDFGGLPSWLLKDQEMKVRSSYRPFLNAVQRYFTKLMKLVLEYQFSVNGGPIIAVQVENEFGSYGDTGKNPEDYEYMSFLKRLLKNLGIKELLFTCDMPSIAMKKGSLEGVLMTANFQTDSEKELEILKELQPDKPLMVAELWSGWFDHWGEKHQDVPLGTYLASLKTILKLKGSFNVYVFQGGTNFNFYNGANIGLPTPNKPFSSTVTSYDYDTLLTEDGRPTEKYAATLALLKTIETNYRRPQSEVQLQNDFLKIENIRVEHFLSLNKILQCTIPTICPEPIPMELIPGANCGQRFGFIVYQTDIKTGGKLEFDLSEGVRTIILVNGKTIATIECGSDFHNIQIEDDTVKENGALSILVENLGRVNFTEHKDILNSQRKGLLGSVFLEGEVLRNWTVYPLDFNPQFVMDACTMEWEEIDSQELGLFSATFNLDKVGDTFLRSTSWTKGIIMVNGFNIGRYWRIGPQQTLFIPQQLLKEGLNQIIAFELHSTLKGFEFQETSVLDEVNKETL